MYLRDLKKNEIEKFINKNKIKNINDNDNNVTFLLFIYKNKNFEFRIINPEGEIEAPKFIPIIKDIGIKIYDVYFVKNK